MSRLCQTCVVISGTFLVLPKLASIAITGTPCRWACFSTGVVAFGIERVEDDHADLLREQLLHVA